MEQRRPEEWTMQHIELPRVLPPLIDEPEEVIAQPLPETDLIVFLSESPQAPQLIPDVAQMTGAQGVIAPIDNSLWVPAGLKNQIQQDLTRLGIASAFPKTFCTLTKNSCGYRTLTENFESDVIAAFAAYFGQPKLEFQINPQTSIVEAVEVVCGAPCGSTHHAAAAMVGLPASEVVPKIGLICHHYPCQASMHPEPGDADLFETLMVLSGHVINEEAAAQIKAMGF